MADVEQSWFGETFAGQKPRFDLWREDDPGGTWRIEPHETTAYVLILKEMGGAHAFDVLGVDRVIVLVE